MTSTQFALPPRSPFGRLALPALAVTFALVYLATRGGAVSLLTSLTGILAVGYLPGLAGSLWVERRIGLWASWILPLLLSPVMAGGAALVLTWFGCSLAAAADWIVAASLLGIAAAPQLQRELEDYTASQVMPGFLRGQSDRQQVVALASLVLGLIALPLLTQSWLRVSGDPALHIGAARNALSMGLPPEDPFLAGMGLRHFWAFHAYLALLADATHLQPEVLMLGGSLIAAFVIVFTGYRLLNLLGLSHLQCLLGVLFLFFALGGAFWITLPGEGLLLRAPPDTWFRSLGVDGVRLPTVDIASPVGFPTASMFFLELFVAGGPLAMGVVYLLLYLAAGVATVGERGWRWRVLTFLAVSGMVLFHGGVALVALVVTLVAAPSFWLVTGTPPWRRGGAELWINAALFGLAAVLAWPYLRQVIFPNGGFDPLTALAVDPLRMVRQLAMLLPSLLLAAGLLLHFLGGEDKGRQAFTIRVAILFALMLVIRFPPPKPTWAPILLAHVPLALMAGAAIPGLWRRAHKLLRPALLLLVLALLVPRTVLGVRAYLSTPDPWDRTPVAAEAARWVSRNTPGDAVVVDPVADLAVAANRSHLCAQNHHLTALGYRSHAVTVRQLAFFTLLKGEVLSPEQRAHLLELRRPLYLVVRVPEYAHLPVAPETERVFQNDGFEIYEWLPARRSP